MKNSPTDRSSWGQKKSFFCFIGFRVFSYWNKAKVESVKHIPSALALRQRPAIPSERATVGTMSELLNVIRLVFSRLGRPVCPNGHRPAPSLKIAQAMSKTGDQMGLIDCPICGVDFYAYSAENLAFNSSGACETCHGTGKCAN